jgi:hypothetical protein
VLLTQWNGHDATRSTSPDRANSKASWITSITPHVTFAPDYIHYRLNHASSALINQVLIKIKGNSI